MRVLVIGYGSMGRRHAANAAALGHEIVVSDADPSARASAATAGYVACDDTSTIAALGLGAAIIASPADLHWWHVSRCSPDLPLLVEKPLSCEAGEWHGTAWHPCSMVGYSLRFHQGVQALHDAVRQYGIINSATFFCRCDKATWPGQSYADMLLEASHEIDLATHLLGPAEVIGAGSYGRDIWSLLLRHASGVLTSVVLDGTYEGYWRGAEIVGPRGALLYDWAGEALAWRWVVRSRDSEQVGYCAPEDTYRAEMAAFLHGTEAWRACTPAEALKVLELCDRARELAR